jgi:hypothetical protein
MQNVLPIVGAGLMALFVGWLFLAERRRIANEVEPVAEALTQADLRAALLPLAKGRMTFEEWNPPIPEVAAYRAQKEGLIVSGQTNDAPSDSEMWMEMTEDGWKFLGLKPASSPVSLSSTETPHLLGQSH